MKAVFLDRDGVINRKAPAGEYIPNWQEFELLPSVLEAAATLHRAGYLLFVVTNQRGLATGRIRETDLSEIHTRMKQRFADAGAPIAEIYCCPHDLEANCQCRKPRPGMLIQAAREHDLKLAESWIVGDSESDIQAGHLAGCKTAQIVGALSALTEEPLPDIAGSSLQTIVTQILESDSNS